MAKDLVCYTGV